MTFDPVAEAEALRETEPGTGHVPLFTERFPSFSWDDARAVARARDDLRRADGEQLIGYKLGWTSSAMREALGIDQPNWGTLWHGHRISDGRLGRSTLRHPKIGPEFVYIAGESLSGSVTEADVMDAAAGWAVGLEVVDPWFADFGFAWLDNTADNSSAGAIVTSNVVTSDVVPSEPEAGDHRFDGREPRVWSMRFGDGEEMRTGVGEVVMGSPAVAVAWLVEQLSAEGAGIEPGMIVFTGGVAAPFDAQPGRTYRAECPELGQSVSLTVH